MLFVVGSAIIRLGSTFPFYSWRLFSLGCDISLMNMLWYRGKEVILKWKADIYGVSSLFEN